MADLIDRQKLIKWFDNWYDHDEFSVGYVVGIIKEQPSVDVEEIVRCKDCKYYRECGCQRAFVYPEPDDFCSRGERK